MDYTNINGYLTKIQGWVGCAKNGMNVDFVKTGHKHNDNRWFFFVLFSRINFGGVGNLCGKSFLQVLPDTEMQYHDEVKF